MREHSPESSLRASSIALARLAEGAFGVTPAFGQSLVEAASVCLEDQGHGSGVNMVVDGSHHAICSLSWSHVTDQCRRTWADDHEATEHGAYGIAFLLI